MSEHTVRRDACRKTREWKIPAIHAYVGLTTARKVLYEEYNGCLCHACYRELGLGPDQAACQRAAEGVSE